MKTEGVITYFDMLQEIDSGQVFDAVFVKADRRRGTGGEIVKIRGWIKCPSEVYSPAHVSTPAHGGKKQKPNHYLHKTRNIMNTRNHLVKRKVHTRLICIFNGKQVV